MSLLRTIFWFEKGELSEIRQKLTARKWGYEAGWESSVLIVFALGGIAAFLVNIWLGLVYCFLCKEAIQSLNKKGFFDPMP